MVCHEIQLSGGHWDGTTVVTANAAAVQNSNLAESDVQWGDYPARSADRGPPEEEARKRLMPSTSAADAHRSCHAAKGRGVAPFCAAFATRSNR
jgi:hypothetical protein